MKIIVGLGNPGEEYRGTRHNTGWMVVDKIIQNLKKMQKGRFLRNDNAKIKIDEKLKAEICETVWKSEAVILVKPLTFMNESGKAAIKIVSEFKGLKVQDDIWLIHDDLDLPLGRIKIVSNRGAAGHKGVESIIKALGTKNFVRFRIGTALAGSLKLKTESYKDYVLGEFKGEEEKVFKRSIKKCAEALIYSLENGIEKAMNKYNISN